MNLSYWERKTWFTNIDYTIVGSGIVGLSCALRLRERFPEASILVIEQGILPQGASTKNAGFACFGSISEILEDLKSHTEQEVLDLVQQRIAGLKQLRQTVGDVQLDYQELGGYELFTNEDVALYNTCREKISYVNDLLRTVFNKDVYSLVRDTNDFRGIRENTIFNQFEGQIDTGKMMQGLLQKVNSLSIKIINNCTVNGFENKKEGVEVQLENFAFTSKNLYIATNGFAKQLNIPRVKPARAQVLITKPIQNLKIKGTFHLDKGYYYFRNIENRILLGGGRNLDFEGEETTELEQTALIQNELKRLLKEVILPETEFEIDHRWSGIMGVGSQKKPIVRQLDSNVYCGVRLGGMGVAIGSTIGRELADLTGD
jgi:glycine/D-amino acid oxidase-like deaminating enzyme